MAGFLLDDDIHPTRKNGETRKASQQKNGGVDGLQGVWETAQKVEAYGFFLPPKKGQPLPWILPWLISNCGDAKMNHELFFVLRISESSSKDLEFSFCRGDCLV